MTDVAAGWYPDPQRPGHERFWDGSAWTADVRPLGAPLPPPHAAPAPPAPQYVPVQPRRSGMSTAAVILLVIVGGFVILVGGCIALLATAGNEVADSIQEAVDQRAEDEALVEDNAVITSCEVGEFGRATATVEFTNPLPEEKGFISIEVSFLDPDGVQIGTAIVTFENLSSGQKAVGETTSFDFVEGSTLDRCVVTDGTVF